MANISLQKAISTCKIDVGWAPRIQSDRFENSDALMCPVWNERDLTGRKVCADSFYTKREGCNSAGDRIFVENDLRPQYMEYVTLDAAGIDGNMYGGNDENVGVTEGFGYRSSGGWGNSRQRRTIEGFGGGCGSQYQAQKNNMFYDDAVFGCQSLENISKVTGQFGQNNFVSDIRPTCGMYAYDSFAANQAQNQRARQMGNQAGKAAKYRTFASTGKY